MPARLTDYGEVSAVGNEQSVNARLFSSLMHEEHIIQTRGANGHHPTLSNAGDGSSAHKLGKGLGICRTDLAEDGQKHGQQRDGPAAIDVSERREYEWRDAAENDDRRCRIRNDLSVLVEGLSQYHQAGVWDCGIERAQEAHERNLKEDRPFQPNGPVLQAWVSH